MFKPRLSRPEYGNPFYNTPQNGGYAIGAILGEPTDKGCNVLSNCVGYSAARFNECIGADKWLYLLYPPNPNQWIERAQSQGLKIGKEPKLGAVLVWGHHVANVEKINSDGTIVTSESGWGCKKPFWTTVRNNNDGCWNGSAFGEFLGFIYLPENDEKMIKNGIDISWCQTQVNWDKVKTDFAIIQAGGGYIPRTKDTMYESHYAGATQAGIPVGAYWFLDATDEKGAVEEAEIFISLLKGKRFAYPVYLDIEKDKHFKLSKAKFSAVCRAFLQKVESAGYWVGLYTNLNGLKNFIEDDIKTRYAIWLAQWDVSKPTYTGTYGIWQEKVGKIEGVTGDVDIDHAYVDYPTKIKAKGLNGFGITNPQKYTKEKSTIHIEMTVNEKKYSGEITEV